MLFKLARKLLTTLSSPAIGDRCSRSVFDRAGDLPREAERRTSLRLPLSVLAIVVLAVSLSSLQAATTRQWTRQNCISVVRTRKHKVTTIARQAIAKQSAERGPAGHR